jgi:hypothetical protein
MIAANQIIATILQAKPEGADDMGSIPGIVTTSRFLWWF